MWRFTRNNGITEGFHRKMKLIQRVPRHVVSGTFLHDKGGSGHDDSGAPWGA
jgi:hypothetical protein